MKRLQNKFKIWLRKQGMLCKKPVYKKPVVKIARTVYPDGKPRLSPNGTGEWYGIVDENKNKKINKGHEKECK